MARLRQAKTHVRGLPRQTPRIGLMPPLAATPITTVGASGCREVGRYRPGRFKPSCRIAGINTSVLRRRPNVLIVGKFGANPMP